MEVRGLIVEFRRIFLGLGSALMGLVLFAGCSESLKNFVEQTVLPDPTYSGSFTGWTHVKSVGTDTPKAADLPSAPAYVTLEWKSMILESSEGESVSVDSYSVFRTTTSGQYDFGNPLANGIGASTRSFTDNTVVAGAVYYYMVLPVYDQEVISVPEADSEIKIQVPIESMVLVHRWAANQDLCGMIGKSVDRNNNYRCEYSGPGSDGIYMDIGYSFWIDQYEVGCNYSKGACGGGDCFGVSNPSGSVSAADGSVYYNRANAYCYLNTSGGTGTTWVSQNNGAISDVQRNMFVSNQAGLPPTIWIYQDKALAYCQAQDIVGHGKKRLPKRIDFIAAAAWPSDYDPLTIDTHQAGLNLPVTGHCNTMNADGVTFDNNGVPADLDTIPYRLSAGRAVLRTGSSKTQNCVSRYGARDLIGNVQEHSGVRCKWVGNTCTAPTVPMTPGDDSLVGMTFPTFATDYIYNLAPYLMLPLGVPWATNDAGTIATTEWRNIFSDYVYHNPGDRLLVQGGSYGNQERSGRFILNFAGAPSTSVHHSVGFRCMLPLSP